jgi:hypothetical protein
VHDIDNRFDISKVSCVAVMIAASLCSTYVLRYNGDVEKVVESDWVNDFVLIPKKARAS